MPARVAPPSGWTNEDDLFWRVRGELHAPADERGVCAIVRWNRPDHLRLEEPDFANRQPFVPAVPQR